MYIFVEQTRALKEFMRGHEVCLKNVCKSFGNPKNMNDSTNETVMAHLHQ